MQVQEEPIMGSKYIFKGKRSKQQRTMSSLALTMTKRSCSGGAEGGDDAGGVYVDLSHFSNGFERFTASHSDSSYELAQSSVEEEEDMANCLILLAQGSSQNPSSQRPNIINRPVADVYQCKTCDRRFPSFQALGGHRASHKKPKVNPPEDKKPALLIANHESTVRLINLQDDTITTLSLQIPGRELCISTNNNKSRVHKCSICGVEFSSGQALGGHMRRHKPLPTVTSSGSSNEDSQELKKQRTLLSLDLNLPAAESEAADCRELKYPFTPKQEAMVFSSSPLVDCHY